MNQVAVLTIDDVARWAAQPPEPFQRSYYAMYSSVLGGIVTDPRLMVVPVDDHLVHRGDGVFETIKCVGGGIYNLLAHLGRLQSSAQGLSIKPPFPQETLADIIIQTVRAAGRRDCLIRVLLSRGPGSLGVSPYDCPASALYVVVSEFKRPFMELHPQGATAKLSSLPVKPGAFANIKSVNYLVNVLMKKEAVDAGVDFAVSLDEQKCLAEGPTENAGIVTSGGVLQVPKPSRILAGTTMLRVLELAKSHTGTPPLKGIEVTDIPVDRLAEAAEFLIFGTTPDVTAVVEFEGHKVGTGKPGPVFDLLSRLLREDIEHNAAMLTPVR